MKNNRGDCLSGARPLITSLHLTLTGLITDNSSNNKMIRVLLLHMYTSVWSSSASLPLPVGLSWHSLSPYTASRTPSSAAPGSEPWHVPSPLGASLWRHREPQTQAAVGWNQ